MDVPPFIHPLYQDNPVSRDDVRKKSIFPWTQLSPVLLGCCCVWTGGEGGRFHPPTPTLPLKDRIRKEKQKSVTGRLEDYCHTAVTVMVPRRQNGGLGGSGGWDGTLSLLFLVISSACGER